MGIASVALLTIGQSPRPDLVGIMAPAIPRSVAVRQVGLLDGMSTSDVRMAYAVRSGEMPLVTRMRDGSVVSISAEKAEKGLQVMADHLVNEGVDLMVLLCTGHFPDLDAGPCLLVQPDAIVPAILSALAPHGRIGVIMPMQAQQGGEPAKWERLGRAPVYAAASPYDEDLSGVEAAGRELASAGVRLIVLDCMGYDAGHEKALRRVVNVPVVLSNRVMARMLALLF